MQHELPELTLDALELLVERLVRDGTSEPSSESYSDSDSDSASMLCWANWRLRALKGGLVELGVDNLAGLAWALWLGSSNAFWGESAALGDG